MVESYRFGGGRGFLSVRGHQNRRSNILVHANRASESHGVKIMRLEKVALIGLAALTLVGCATNSQLFGRQDDAIGLATAADTAYLAEDWEAAEARYRDVIARVPNDAHAYFKLGNTLLKLDRWDEAVGAYRNALTVDPSHSKAASNLASVYLMQADQALHIAIDYMKDNDPRAAMLVLREKKIHEIVNIPVDENKASGTQINGYVNDYTTKYDQTEQ